MESFSFRAKNEITAGVNSAAKADACLLGILYTCKAFNNGGIQFVTENPATCEFFVKCIDRICGKGHINIVEGKRSASSVYNIFADAQAFCSLTEYFRLPEDLAENGYKNAVVPKKKLLPYFFGGVFISCGSLSDPNKDYHMEFVFQNMDICNFLGLILIDNYGIVPKQTERKGQQVVYIKESENIEDMLTLMGAQSCSLEIMNIKIFKDIRNKVNRAVNCDNANIEKTLRAAKKQIADIELIEQTVGLEQLPDELREIAELRLENPDLNLKELGAALSRPVSRSGANHRLARIAEIAEKIRKQGS